MAQHEDGAPESGFDRAEPSAVAALFRCRSVALIGASSNPTRFSGKILPALQRQGFAGRIYPINSNRSEIGGLACYPDLASVPGPVDCVVYALAAEHVGTALKDCSAKNVKLLVVPSAGFAERGDAEGRLLQDELMTLARSAGMRVLGPNCIGFVNLVDRVCVSAAAVLDWPDIACGRIGLVSQSGGLGLATIAYEAFAQDIFFSHIVTTGNEADLDTIDVARFLVDDPATDVVAMTVEAVRDTAGFIALVRAAGRAGKPLVVLKSGRSDLGKVMAASHTGALAGSAAIFSSVCRQFGVVEANDVDELIQFSRMFAQLRQAGKLERARDPGRHCAAMSLSGGHVGLFADHASLAGLTFPPFSPQTEQAVADVLGFSGHFLNPLDTTARVIGTDDFWGRCTKALLADPAIEVAVPIITVSRSYERAVRDLVAVAERSDKIVLVLWAGGDFEGDARRLLRGSLVPHFSTPARAAAAIRALDTYCRVWGRGNAEEPAVRATPVKETRAVLARALAAGRKALTEHESKAVLQAIGFFATREDAAHTEDEAAEAAAAIGFPVVLKGEHPAILHKSEAGLVMLNRGDEAAVRAAYRTLQARMVSAAPASAEARVLVQEMVPRGTELILGLTDDPEFGTLVLLGFGGIYTEILDDAVTRLPPFGHGEAAAMIAELRGAAILQGARGMAPADLPMLADLLVRLGDFALGHADLVAELDINPLIVLGADGFKAADALIVLKLRKGHADGN